MYDILYQTKQFIMRLQGDYWNASCKHKDIQTDLEVVAV